MHLKCKMLCSDAFFIIKERIKICSFRLHLTSIRVSYVKCQSHNLRGHGQELSGFSRPALD